MPRRTRLERDSIRRAGRGGAATGTATPTQIDVGDTGDPGVSTSAAREDHQHALPVPVAPPAIAAASSAGVSTKVAREDHTHAGVTSVDGGGGALVTGSIAPTQIDVGDAQTTGTAATFARADHQHALPAPAAPPSIAAASSAGAATTVARADHTHAGVTSVNGSGGAVVGFLDKLIEADNAEVLDSADWPVASAPAGPDSVNAAEIVRFFDDTTEEGWGWSAYVPEGATNLILTFTAWANVAPAATRTAGNKVWARRYEHNVALPAPGAAGWFSVVLADLSFPANRRPQITTITVALASFSTALVAGSKYHFVWSRPAPGAGTELVGDVCMRSIRLRAS